ncbi:hypothetical protein ACOME3_005636 [Neoechinorhynchus agilis]
MFSFHVQNSCSKTKARLGLLRLPHIPDGVETPIFMPVATQATLKGTFHNDVLDEIDCRLILGNTYHLGHRPDSGGFQMVSLLELSECTEEGVRFKSPHDNSLMLLSPEKSMEIQNLLGADIIMQLDDVVHSCTRGPRVEEAMKRSIRWLDRCIEAHRRPNSQALFPIVQGGLDRHLRTISAKEVAARSSFGYAIGGLSGGEEKENTVDMINLCTDILPIDKPRYAMGIGYAIDLVIFCGLGCDMYDCVFPTRTARFGHALVDKDKSIDLKHSTRSKEFHEPIDYDCSCYACQSYSRAFLHNLFKENEPVAVQLSTIHNLHYQMRLMRRIRESIRTDTYLEFTNDFVEKYYDETDGPPTWILRAIEQMKLR